MTTDNPIWGRIERGCLALIDRVSGAWLSGTLALVVIVLATGLPGLVRLPPVDRTEVVYAETSREMLNAGRLVGPTYLGEHERHRPIGTFWLQMAAAKLLGDGARDRISTYRIPSLMGVLGAVLATYWLLSGVAGRRVAWGAAALVAVTPIAVLQSQLAITESITFGPAIVAELALLRIYVANDGAPTRGVAALMWAALGIAITLNALAVPILLVATVIALYVMDRELGWLRRLHAMWGVPVMIALGSPWIIALVMAEGGWPFAGLGFNEFLNLLGGSQAMKLRAWPGTFTLGLIVGFLPGVLLLWPAIMGLWRGRAARLPRFLFAWIAGYLVYLEAISSKPALYTVQVLLPAAAAAVMLLLAGREGGALRFPTRVAGWPGLLFAALYPVLIVVLHKLTYQPLTFGMVAGALSVAVLLALPAVGAHLRLAGGWLVATVIGFAAFLAFTFGVVLPAQKNAWATEVIHEAVAPLRACGEVAVVGYREPSAVFTFGAGNVFLSAGDLSAASRTGKPPVRFVIAEDAMARDVAQARPSAGPPDATPQGCIESFNVTRGCVQRFKIFDWNAAKSGGDACGMGPDFAAKYSCATQGKAFSGAARCK